MDNVEFWRWILIKTYVPDSKRLFARRLYNEFPNKDWKDKDWINFYESCAQPVWSNALQEAVSHGYPELQITSAIENTDF